MTWRAELAAALGTKIVRAEPVSGGDINDAYRVELADRRTVFVKTHHSPPPGMYAAEAAGLAWLADGPLRTPRVLAAGDAFLALEWLELGDRDRTSEEQLARGLAALHELGAPTFGLDRSNYLATIPQDNTPETDIATFYVERRLRPLVAQLGLPDLDAQLDALAQRADRFGPPEPPARLHGDLWWGNVGFSRGEPVLVDPAVYGGHREIDIAMLALFGGVTETFISAYSEVYPLASEWRSRVQLWQLYPIAAHGVLFGSGYTTQLARMLRELTSA
jgi:fructosamine-3-kinase